MANEQAREAPKNHALSMENRETLSLTGVDDVSGFDESAVVLSTALGALTVRGDDLHIDRIDLELGELELRGRIRELSYEEPSPTGSLWSRLFG